MWHWPLSSEGQNQVSDFLLDISPWVPYKHFTLNNIKTKSVTSAPWSNLFHLWSSPSHWMELSSLIPSNTESNISPSKMHFRSVLSSLSLHYHTSAYLHCLSARLLHQPPPPWSLCFHSGPSTSHLPHSIQESFHRSIWCPFLLHQNKSKLNRWPLHFTDEKNIVLQIK